MVRVPPYCRAENDIEGPSLQENGPFKRKNDFDFEKF